MTFKKYKCAPENVRTLCNLKIKQKASEIQGSMNEHDTCRLRDSVIKEVVSDWSLTSDQIALLASRYHDSTWRFTRLLIPNLDPSEPCSNKDMLGEYFVRFLSRLFGRQTLPDNEWWSESGDWTYSLSNPYDSPPDGFYGENFEYEQRERGFDLIFIWHHLCLHEPTCVKSALEILSTIECGCHGFDMLDINQHDCTISVFLSSLVVALQMLDEKRKKEFLDLYLKFFGDWQYQTRFPDRSDFFNFFFSSSEDEFGLFMNEQFGNYVPSGKTVWGVLMNNPDQSLKEMFRSIRSTKGNEYDFPEGLFDDDGAKVFRF